MAKALASGALSLLVLILIAFAGFLGWSRETFVGQGPLQTAICFEVPRGANLTRVTAALHDAGAISHPQIFRVGAGYMELADDLKFGSYVLAAGISMQDVLGIITEGGQSTCGREKNFRIGVTGADIVLRAVDPATSGYVEVAKYDPLLEPAPPILDTPEWQSDVRLRVTLAEGVTSWQVVEALKAAPFLTGDLGDVPPEGSLAPDSYEVTEGMARADLLAQMAARQERVLAQAWAARAEGLPYKSPQEALIMASIVEKETGIADERRQVASVFLNRIAQGMRLQTDPTVIYGITLGQGVLGRGLRRSELDRPTPYNTYQIDGLPPTPIANPGKLSIEAALNPDSTPYIFFVADGTGGHAFSVTLREHNENVARWREIEAKMAAEAEAAGDGAAQ